jgi:regulator-associated protein of mTOR
LHTFANLNPSNSRITALKFINEEDSSILLVGSNEGIVRLYRNYDDPDSIKLLSAWKAADDLFPSKPGTFICEWHQMNGTLLTMGKTPIIKVWDADEEICIQDIPIDVESIPTCLHVETSGNLFLTGFENGDITLKDRRMSSGSSHYKGSNGKVLSAQFSNADGIEFMSATTEGDLLLWDIRQTTPILKIESARGPFNSFTIHNQAPLMAW